MYIIYYDLCKPVLSIITLHAKLCDKYYFLHVIPTNRYMLPLHGCQTYKNTLLACARESHMAIIHPMPRQFCRIWEEFCPGTHTGSLAVQKKKHFLWSSMCHIGSLQQRPMSSKGCTGSFAKITFVLDSSYKCRCFLKPMILFI